MEPVRSVFFPCLCALAVVPASVRTHIERCRAECQEEVIFDVVLSEVQIEILIFHTAGSDESKY